MQFPLGVFGIAISIAILPTLSGYVSRNQHSEMKESFSFGIKILSLFVLPSMVGLIVLSYPIIRFFYEHGLFGSNDTDLTTIALICYTVGLFATAALRLVISSFYALKDTKTPLKIGIYIVIFNIILDLALVRYFGHAGIALATSLAAILHLIVLSYSLQNKTNGIFSNDLLLFFYKISFASIIMGISCWFISQYVGTFIDLNIKLNQFLQLIISISGGLIVYYISGIILSIPEFRNSKSIIRKIIKGKMEQDDTNY